MGRPPTDVKGRYRTEAADDAGATAFFRHSFEQVAANMGAISSLLRRIIAVLLDASLRIQGENLATRP
jgi:hypothetical protein